MRSRELAEEKSRKTSTNPCRRKKQKKNNSNFITEMSVKHFWCNDSSPFPLHPVHQFFFFLLFREKVKDFLHIFYFYIWMTQTLFSGCLFLITYVA